MATVLLGSAGKLLVRLRRARDTRETGCHSLVVAKIEVKANLHQDGYGRILGRAVVRDR